jgi:hypothetical protein
MPAVTCAVPIPSPINRIIFLGLFANDWPFNGKTRELLIINTISERKIKYLFDVFMIIY